MRKIMIILAVMSAVSVILASGAGIKRVNTKLKDQKKTETEQSDTTAGSEKLAQGSFMVASQCPTCNNGYTLDQLAFAGYDKPLTSTRETFFVTNKTDRTLTGVNMYIEYLTVDGRQLDRRFVSLDCEVPPGETRKLEVKSWDTQKSFYYKKSVQPKRQATPFDVKFDLVAYYLR